MTHDGLTNPFTGKQMINEASEVSNELEITRADMDRFAERSHRLAAEATDAGRLAEEIVGVTVKSRKGETTVEADEAIRPDTTLETLAEAEGGRRRGRDPHRRQRPGRQRRRRRDRRRLRGVGREGRQDAARHASSPTAPSPTTSPTWRGRPANAAKQALEKIGKSARGRRPLGDQRGLRLGRDQLDADARRRRGEGQRQRRRDRPRPPDRRLRRPHRRRPRPRAPPPRRRPRRRRDLLRRRPGRRDRDRGQRLPRRSRGEPAAGCGVLRSGQDPDGGVERDAVRPRRRPARDRRPPPARQLGGRAPALPPARHHRRAHRRGAAGRPRADHRRAGARRSSGWARR